MAEIAWLHYALARTPWYELPAERRAELLADWDAVRTASLEAGARTDGVFTVRGQSDYSTVEIWFFPDVDGAYDHWQRLVAAGYAQWFEAANSIGTALDRP